MKQLVATEWLEKNIDQVKILDATWYLPNSNRSAEEEFKLNHIKNSIFFDIDKNSDQNTSIPHMLPSIQKWEEIVSNLGLKNSDHVIFMTILMSTVHVEFGTLLFTLVMIPISFQY